MRRAFIAGVALGCLGGAAALSAAQLPLASAKASSQTVTPVFEGWYRNPDGTFSLSFGYFNRNAEEVVDIPIGPNNFIEPGAENQGQPTEFQPRRHWGVFAVKVPADFGTKQVVWTLKFRGATYSIPGSLHRNWQIDALEGEAGSGNTPPLVKFDAGGPEGSGPGGFLAGPVTAASGNPLTLTVWAQDDGKPASGLAGGGRGGGAGPQVTLAWFKHQGPGKVTFAPATGRVAAAGGQLTSTAAFSEPGEYILRVRANDGSGVANAGHAQCCWSNGFLKVTVSR
jgi:hypothetical protein